MSEKKIQPKKTAAVNDLKAKFDGVKDIFFTNYRGLTVEQITNVRRKLREQKATYKVLKNNFAKIAFRELDLPAVDEYLTGPTAVAFTKADSGPVAKILLDFTKEMPIELKGGIVAGAAYGPKQVEEYSKLPTRMELIAQLLSVMQAPVRNAVYALNAIPTKLVRTLKAIADKKGTQG
jgi:large subunit ribosomal protein L10